MGYTINLRKQKWFNFNLFLGENFIIFLLAKTNNSDATLRYSKFLSYILFIFFGLFKLLFLALCCPSIA